METEKLSYCWRCLILILLTVIGTNIATAQTPDSVQKSITTPQAIQLTTSLEKSKVPLNEIVNFRVELSWNGELNQYLVEPVSQPILINLLMEGSGSENRLEPLPEGGFRAIKAFTYRLKPLEIGMAYIDGMTIKYRNRTNNEEDQLVSQRVMVEIADPVADGPSGVKSYLYIVLIILFVGIIVYSLIKYFRKRRQMKTEPEETISLPEKYLEYLGQEVDPRGTNLAEMTAKLSSIFREYLSVDFSIPARGASTEEILKHLDNIEVDDNDRANLKTVFEKLDLIKFAGKDIDPSDFSNIYGAIEAFLLKRKQLRKTTTDQL